MWVYKFCQLSNVNLLIFIDSTDICRCLRSLLYSYSVYITVCLETERWNDFYSCGNGKEIPAYKTCDNHDDCGDNLDEDSVKDGGFCKGTLIGQPVLG